MLFSTCRIANLFLLLICMNLKIPIVCQNIFVNTFIFILYCTRSLLQKIIFKKNILIKILQKEI